jgi:acetate kinase
VVSANDSNVAPRSGRIILSIDLGSSSLKLAVHRVGSDCELCLLEGGIEAFGTSNAALWIRDDRYPPRAVTRRLLGPRTPVAVLLAFLEELDVAVDAIGHRLVYGGPAHEAPARITSELLTSLAGLVSFDPLHLTDALTAIREFEKALPDVPQVVCFDTAFHRRMPMVAQRLPLPRELWAEGVRRYGFHGLSYESIVRQLGDAGTRGRMIVAHLGNGASVAAMRDGSPVDTTMGFSPLGGVMMGTRPGDLDPGVLLYLLREGRYTLRELEDVLTRQSGLLGVSGNSADMQLLLQRRASDSAAAEAVELFVYFARKHIGALAATLGGLDTLVFTGGIGMNAAPVRWEIAEGLAFLGLKLDPACNVAGAPIVSADGSRVVVRVMETNENLMVARHTWATLFQAAASKVDDPAHA